VILVATGGLAAPAGAGAPSAEKVLDEIASFVDDAKAVRFTAEFEVGGVGVGTLLEEAAFPNRGRTLLTFGGSDTETIFVKSKAFVRVGEAGGDLSSIPFTQLPNDSEFTTFSRPQDILRIDELLEDLSVDAEGALPEVCATTQCQVLHGAFKEPEKLIRGTPTPYTEARLDVVVAEDGELLSIVLTATSDITVTATADIAWDEPVTITQPKPSQIRKAIDKAAVKGFGDAKLYQPAAIPSNWKLVGAHVATAAETFEACEEVNTIYGSPPSLGGTGFLAGLDVFQFPTSCPGTDPAFPDGQGQPFTVGSYQGTILEQGNGLILAQIDVDGTTFQVETRLSRADLEALLADLVPLNFKKPPKATLPEVDIDQPPAGATGPLPL